MKIAFYGSSLLSSYWNGAATYYRGLLRDLARRGKGRTSSSGPTSAGSGSAGAGNGAGRSSLPYCRGIEIGVEPASDVISRTVCDMLTTHFPRSPPERAARSCEPRNGGRSRHAANERKPCTGRGSRAAGGDTHSEGWAARSVAAYS